MLNFIKKKIDSDFYFPCFLLQFLSKYYLGKGECVRHCNLYLVVEGKSLGPWG